MSETTGDPVAQPVAAATNASQPPQVSLPQAFFEAFFVVLGVLLALAANEWREDRRAAAHAATALSSIVDELRTNRDAVASSLDYHRTLAGKLREHRAAGSTPDIRTFGRGFVHPASVLRTAWSTAGATNAFEELDYDIVLALSQIYATQGAYENQAQSIGQLVYQQIMEGGTEALLARHRQLGEIITTFLWREQTLLGHYDQVLTELGVEAPGTSEMEAGSPTEPVRRNP